MIPLETVDIMKTSCTTIPWFFLRHNRLLLASVPQGSPIRRTYTQQQPISRGQSLSLAPPNYLYVHDTKGKNRRLTVRLWNSSWRLSCSDIQVFVNDGIRYISTHFTLDYSIILYTLLFSTNGFFCITKRKHSETIHNSKWRPENVRATFSVDRIYRGHPLLLLCQPSVPSLSLKKWHEKQTKTWI